MEFDPRPSSVQLDSRRRCGWTSVAWPRDTPPSRRWRCCGSSASDGRSSGRRGTWPSASRRRGGRGGALRIQSLQKPDESAGYVLLRNCGISTSGDTYRFVEIGGKRYSHIIDPRTGLGLTHRIGVTVVAPDAFTTDWLSTAVSILGPEKGLRVVERIAGAAVRIVTLDGRRAADRARVGAVQSSLKRKPVRLLHRVGRPGRMIRRTAGEVLCPVCHCACDSAPGYQRPQPESRSMPANQQHTPTAASPLPPSRAIDRNPAAATSCGDRPPPPSGRPSRPTPCARRRVCRREQRRSRSAWSAAAAAAAGRPSGPQRRPEHQARRDGRHVPGQARGEPQAASRPRTSATGSTSRRTHASPASTPTRA